jgi:hypothetical protein
MASVSERENREIKAANASGHTPAAFIHNGGGFMVEDQLGADVRQRTTAGSLWQAVSGRPLSADLLGWPPDLFALTSLLLQRSGAFRFALSPPPGRQWPPGSRSGWSTTVEAAGRAWSGVVDAPGSRFRRCLSA